MKDEKTSSNHKKISLNISNILESLPPIKKLDLTPTEQKAYLNLAIEFKRLVDSSENYLKAANKWSQSLPRRLSLYGITTDEWDRISSIGDNSTEIQGQVKDLIKRLEEW
ncbi:MAG: hypothetical protein ACXAC8_06085 [Candidatus Hodarchaeales archaeon]